MDDHCGVVHEQLGALVVRGLLVVLSAAERAPFALSVFLVVGEAVLMEDMGAAEQHMVFESKLFETNRATVLLAKATFGLGNYPVPLSLRKRQLGLRDQSSFLSESQALFELFSFEFEVLHLLFFLLFE